MKEEELIRTKHVGEVMKVLHDATDHAYNPDELLTVPLFFSCFHFKRLLGANTYPVVKLH